MSMRMQCRFGTLVHAALLVACAWARPDDDRCDTLEGFAKFNYELCCHRGRDRKRRDICAASVRTQEEDDERTPSWPKLRSNVSTTCTACTRLVDNFENALLPRLKKRHDILRKHHSRTRLAASATVGELEAIVEDEVDQICAWPRTQHQPTIRNACNKLVEERSDQIVVAISSWARDGSYGLHLKDEIDDELRPALCEQELQVCTSAELEEQVRVDADEKAKMETANDNGFVADRPLESEAPSNAKDDVLVRVVGADFIKRIVVDAADADFLVYMFFPGRTLETEDTHSRMRPKYVRLAQFLDAPGSNGSLIVGWMDCVFNAIPHPHGTHVHQDLVALYPAGRKNQPAYWHNLREGDVELHQLIDFVRDASGNSKTRAHVHDRARELGQRALYEALPSNLMDYEESLFVDERTIEAINVTAMRLSLEEQDGNINRPARLAHNPTSKDEL